MSIKNCNCVSEYQDKKYGRGNRVHNKAKSKSGKGDAHRCTVCEKVKNE
jgi:hypothetical protein